MWATTACHLEIRKLSSSLRERGPTLLPSHHRLVLSWTLAIWCGELGVLHGFPLLGALTASLWWRFAFMNVQHPLQSPPTQEQQNWARPLGLSEASTRDLWSPWLLYPQDGSLSTQLPRGLPWKISGSLEFVP